MNPLSDDLFEIAERLGAMKARDDLLAINKILSDLEKEANAAGKAWSGSWLGYQAYVYYRDLQSPPAGAHFSQAWGLRETGFSEGTAGDWVEYEDDAVRNTIYKGAGNPDMQPAQAFAETAKHTFEDCRAEVLSSLTTALEGHEDSFLSGLKEEAEKCRILSEHDCIKVFQPKGQFIAEDALAVSQGLRTPPHLAVLATVYALKSPGKTCENLTKVARRAASHLAKRERYSRRTQEIGTNVFIGHGRSPAWKDLKDFIQDRLRLPWDEFNRVPVPGRTNIDRLSEMLNDAAIAFLVMTAEDEHPDGTTHARKTWYTRQGFFRENSAFQKRLFFSKRIVNSSLTFKDSDRFAFRKET